MPSSLLNYSANAQSLLFCTEYRPSDREQKWPLETRHFMISICIGLT